MKLDNKVWQIIKDLEQERAEACQELLRLREALKTEIDVNFGEGDPEMVDRDMTISLIHEQERKLDSLDQALQQARRGAYGICERCGQPIDPARLEAVPDTTLCVTCKAILERQQRYSR
jgi:RNA polymerase-binding transcription factor DksA